MFIVQTLQPNNVTSDMSCGRSHFSDKLPLIWTELPQNAQAHSSQLDNVMQVDTNGSSKYVNRIRRSRLHWCTCFTTVNNVIGV